MPSEDALVGQTLIEKYKILRQIGRGGMGVVYEAEHIELGKRVAIKLMLEKYAEDGEALTRFRREALAASRIGNPHIIDISDIGTMADGRMFVVMELLLGQPLADLIKRGPLPAARASRIMRQTLKAVGAAHAKSIIHRDLKPDNIFLVGDDDQQDFVKLLDFGISKVVDQAAEIAATKLTSTGTVMGTPLYMAPEQAMGEATDHRADIYALGVIMYEMLVGKPPFEGANYPALVMKLLTTEPTLISELRSDVPAHVVAAVHRALEKEAPKRHASCEAFAQALGPATTGEQAAVMLPASASASASASIALDRTMNSGEVAVLTPSKLQAARPVVSADSGPQPTPPPAAPASTRSKTPIIVAVLGGGLLVAVGAIVVMMMRDQAPAGSGATATPIVDGTGSAGGSGAAGDGVHGAAGSGAGSPSVGTGTTAGTAPGVGTGTTAGTNGGTTGGTGTTADTNVRTGTTGTNGGAGSTSTTAGTTGTGSTGVGTGSIGTGATGTRPGGTAIATGAPGATGSKTLPRATGTTGTGTTTGGTGSPAITQPHNTGPGTTGGSTPGGGGTTVEDVSAAIKRHDGKGCRAALAALASPPPTDFRVASLHAVCEMVAGNCAGGLAEQRALYKREGTPESSADIIGDLYCPPGKDPATRLRRIAKQISMSAKFECSYYLGPARDAAKAASTDKDKHAVGAILATIATCFSHRGQCDVAKQVLGEAQVFIPALALNELNAQCR